MGRACVMMFGFLLAGLFLWYIGQGVVPQGAPEKCEADLNVFEVLGIAVASVTVSVYCVKALGKLHGRRFTYLHPWSLQGERHQNGKWWCNEVFLALCCISVLLSSWLFASAFLSKISDRDRGRYFLTCIFIVIEQWIVYPILHSLLCTCI